MNIIINSIEGMSEISVGFSVSEDLLRYYHGFIGSYGLPSLCQFSRHTQCDGIFYFSIKRSHSKLNDTFLIENTSIEIVTNASARTKKICRYVRKFPDFCHEGEGVIRFLCPIGGCEKHIIHTYSKSKWNHHYMSTEFTKSTEFIDFIRVNSIILE